jgi:hypothetical protein
VLLEGGVDAAHGVEYPVSGLKGNLWRIPSVGISVGISSIAELQIDGGLYDKLYITERRVAPLSNLLTIGTDTSTHDVEDTVVATKIRFLSETEGRPALGVRFATKLPNASNESGLGLDTTDFYMTCSAPRPSNRFASWAISASASLRIQRTATARTTCWCTGCRSRGR